MIEKRQIKVIIVEDELIIAESMRRVLVQHGFIVAGLAYDAENGYKMIEKYRPDLILLDINLGKTNGFDLLEKVNDLYSPAAIFITGYFTEEFLGKANELGAYGYVVKPVNDKQLMASIEIAIQRYTAYQALNEDYQTVSQRLEARKYIEMAKGILMKRRGIDEETAMLLLQKKSKDNNEKIVIVAKKIIEADSLL